MQEPLLTRLCSAAWKRVVATRYADLDDYFDLHVLTEAGPVRVFGDVVEHDGDERTILRLAPADERHFALKLGWKTDSIVSDERLSQSDAALLAGPREVAVYRYPSNDAGSSDLAQTRLRIAALRVSCEQAPDSSLVIAASGGFLGTLQVRVGPGADDLVPENMSISQHQ